jgi:hypothetical protein
MMSSRNIQNSGDVEVAEMACGKIGAFGSEVFL